MTSLSIGNGLVTKMLKVGVGGIVWGAFSSFDSLHAPLLQAANECLDCNDAGGPFPRVGISFEVDGPLGTARQPVPAKVRLLAAQNELAIYLRFFDRTTVEEMAEQVEETTCSGLLLAADRLQKERKLANLQPFRDSIQAFRVRFRELALAAKGAAESPQQQYIRKVYEDVKNDREKYPHGTEPYFGM